MNKAILVIDEMPFACCDCPVSEFLPGGDSDDEYICRVIARRVDEYVFNNAKPAWCPLRMLPNAVKVYENDERNVKDWAAGWNMCLQNVEGR